MKNDFSKLKSKIFIRVLLIGGITIFIGLGIEYILLDGFLQNFFIENFIDFCKSGLHLDSNASSKIYQYLLRNNKGLLMSIGLYVLLLFIFYQSLSRFIKYFSEVSDGLDQLLEESVDEITLSPEMAFMEAKLNKIKITLEKRKKSAQESEQRKNELVVYLAHDIKTPLTSVIGYLNLLDEAKDMPVEQKARYVGITLEKAYHLEQLINEFFEITRFNMTTIVLNKKEINLQFMLLQMADEFYPMLVPKGKKVEVNVQDDLKVYGDVDKIARVFNNILKNAIAYSYENSTIQISAERQQCSIVIVFINQGKIISKNKLDKIFEKFYRLDTARSTSTGGAGLGLAIAKEIIDAHGGTISAESNEESTKFIVTLPFNI
ncbi:HAMP domain-containing sensor histidine kinase [Clostridium sp. ZC22-4]|uniref:histidine kinase n=1 Tax=Clostridium brassicae TaxID=2999072 RepID=A0ABT4D8C1_9CLOT|nr:HAMP domain-containing sensor histidine kinase [Clostridium brassicae]MCY6958543.1 HAMP domain-containing sensor histidine kinase [Clostridium brassicae]